MRERESARERGRVSKWSNERARERDRARESERVEQ